MKEAMFWDGSRCNLCPRRCIIPEEGVGVCKVRKNENGTLYSLNYGKLTAVHVDPIEKKPLFHFYPGSEILSIGSSGCNFMCKNCQNWEISQRFIDTEFTPPEKIVEMAKPYGMIAFTYNEPTVFYEYAYDVAKLAKKRGLKTVWVSNGYINDEPLKKIAKYLDAANIDFKGFNNRVWMELVGGVKLDTFLDRLKAWAKTKIHLELTYLIIPNWNDKDIEPAVKWIKDNVGDVPLHFSRYFPMYKLMEKPTPIQTLKHAYEIGKKYLSYVYVGNAPELDLENTYCPKCGELVIKRYGYIVESSLKDGKCPKCGEKIATA